MTDPVKDCPAEPVNAPLHVFEEPSPDGTYLETPNQDTVAHVRSVPPDAGYMDMGFSTANARRLAACWNACKSSNLATDVLEHVAETEGLGLMVTFTPANGVEALQEQAREDYQDKVAARIDQELDKSSGFPGYESGLKKAKTLLETDDG